MANCSVICAIVRSPLIAVMATFALKAAEWLRLGHLHHWMHLSRRHYRAHRQAADPLTLPSEIVELFLISAFRKDAVFRSLSLAFERLDP